MAPQNKINLKDKFEDGELDLSLSELQEVPVKDIAALKKVKILDLSNNQLTTITKSFPTLTTLVKLDLSKNMIKHLPENFGDLKQLKHLDLYSNQLTHLPLSFGELKLLRWLDLKNNPLVPAIAEIAGSCLDSQQCEHCAKNVVSIFAQMLVQVEEEKLRRAAKQKEAQITEQTVNVKSQKKVKKSKAQKKQDDVAVKNVDIKRTVSQSTRKSVKVNPQKNEKSKSYLSIMKFLLSIIFMLVFCLFVLSSLKGPFSVIGERTVLMWNKLLELLPTNLRVLFVKVGECVHVLHSFTGTVTQNIVILIQNYVTSENVQLLLKFIYDAANFVVIKLFAFCVVLSEMILSWIDVLMEKLIPS